MKQLMAIWGLVALCLWAETASAEAISTFDQYFDDETLRIDLYQIGDSESEWTLLDRLYQEGQWPGSRVHLVDPLNNGRFEARLIEPTTGVVLWSKGFDTQFGEYRTTDPALQGVKKAYSISVRTPYPRAKVMFELLGRDAQAKLVPVFRSEIDPTNPFINRFHADPSVSVLEVQKNGDIHAKVDLAFIAEGYTDAERTKFEADLRRFTALFFRTEPYATRAKDFNVYGVFKASQESGIDEPVFGAYRNTTLGTSFDTFGSDRYILTEENRALRDVAAHVPYDALYIMINSSRYGGGGLYNTYCTFTTDSQWPEYLFIHEFGHSFGGLADEYYTSSVATNDLYPPQAEPTEPNITALLEPGKVKWQHLVNKKTPLPTPWKKDVFDANAKRYAEMRDAMNAEEAALRKSGASEQVMREFRARSEAMSLNNAQETQALLASERYAKDVGAFQGAGYDSEGLYRPSVDCIMFTRGLKPFCPVCHEALNRVINLYLEN